MGGVWCEGAVAGSQSREKSESITRTLRRSKVHSSSTDDNMSKPYFRDRDEGVTRGEEESRE